MKIGDLAAATETSVEAIRYYERAGLLAAPARSEGNYRLYGEAHVQRLAFIRRCRALDMTLEEVRALLGFVDAPGPDCAHVDALLDEHIGHVTQRIADLRRLQRELRELRARCVRLGGGVDCGILQGLLDGAAMPPATRRQAAPGGHARGVHRPIPGAKPARARTPSHKASHKASHKGRRSG